MRPALYRKWDISQETVPNCKVSKSDAEAAWGPLVNEKIGYFEGCGGDCDDSCAKNIKPTSNSIMRYHNLISTKPECSPINDGKVECQGPPFDPFYGVNERELLNVLSKFK